MCAQSSVIISANSITKNYGGGKGVFDVDLNVREGEIFGFLGPNGAGKTTTIRQLLGFIKPDKGSCSILGMDCFKQAADIQKHLGYLAGEIALFGSFSGEKMIRFIAEMKGVGDRKRINELIERFELDASGKVRKMSKGMKQKLGIVCAFMSDPKVLILDEPTSGLDPLMQARFVELVLSEKSRGKTVFMSSHIFEETEKTCDRAAIIKAGRIADIENVESMRKKKLKYYHVTLRDEAEALRLAAMNIDGIKLEGRTAIIPVGGDIPSILGLLSGFKVEDIDITAQTLEELFLHFYTEEEQK